MQSLNDIIVLDFSKLLPGPYCSMLLADLGCRVIKVELPHWPDMLRGIGPEIDGHGFVYWMANRGKESLCIDFRKAEGRRMLLRMVERADVLLEGFRPGMMRRLGLGAEELTKKYPDLVYCSISGFGQQGPMSERAGHDINFLGESGFMGAGDSNGGYSFGATQAADLCGSHTAAVAILGALLDRERTGHGRRIDISMSEAMFSWLVLPVGYQLGTGRPYDRKQGHWWAGASPFYRVYQTKDRQAMIAAALERPFAESLLRELGLESLTRLIGRDDAPSRKRLGAAMARAFRSKTRKQWEAQLAGKDACVTPVRSVAEAAERFSRPPAPGMPPLLQGRTLRSPIRLNREDPEPGPKPARLGQDNEPVLDFFGISPQEIRALKAAGILQRPRRLRGATQP